MNRLKILLMTISYIISAFIVSILLTLVYHFAKPMFEYPPSRRVLALSEIVVRSQEVVTGYWRKYQQCPTPQSLSAISRLALVNKLEVIPYTEHNQCQLTLDIENKKIKLLFSFTKVKDPLGSFTCYTNVLAKNSPVQCQQLRDIDSFDQEN